MYSVRKSVFETNSSSTHSLTIDRRPLYNLNDFEIEKDERIPALTAENRKLGIAKCKES